MGILISVVIPVYNKRKSIRRSVDSALRQSYHDFELLVIDDGSTDGSLAELSDIKDARLKRFQKENSGVSATRNLGMEMAQGCIVAFLDGDDVWDENYLKRLKDMYQSHPDCAMFFQTNKIVPYKEFDSYSKHTCPEKPVICSTDWEKNFYFRDFYTSSIAVNKEKALSMGGFDTSLTIGEDLDLWFRLMLAFPMCFLDEIHVFILKYEADYHSRQVPLDYRKHFSYMLITHPELYLSLKDNIDVRKVMNKVIFFAWLCFTKDKNEAAVRLLSKHIRFSLLNYKDKIKYILYHLGLLDSYRNKL